MIALAVDAGGTSTRAVVLDGTGTCLGYGRAGSGNPVSAGVALASASVAESCRVALRMAGAAACEVETLLVAMAGGVAEEDMDVFRGSLREAGVDTPPLFRGDALAVFCSGTWRDHGCALIVGTGAVAIRVESGESVATSDGLGWLLGDDGSGFWIGHRVVRAALAALEGRGPATCLTDLLLAELPEAPGSVRMSEGREPRLPALMEALYRCRPVELARFAPLAFRAGPDPIAQAIIADAAHSLAVTLTSVMDERPGPVVFGGGTLAHNAALVQQVVAGLPAGVGSQARVVTDGLAGAAVLALRAAGRTIDAAGADRIARSLVRLLPARGGSDQGTAAAQVSVKER